MLALAATYVPFVQRSRGERDLETPVRTLEMLY